MTAKETADNSSETLDEASKSQTTKQKKIPLIDLGSARIETKGGYGGFADAPSRGNDRPHPEPLNID